MQLEFFMHNIFVIQNLTLVEGKEVHTFDSIVVEDDTDQDADLVPLAVAGAGVEQDPEDWLILPDLPGHDVGAQIRQTGSQIAHGFHLDPVGSIATARIWSSRGVKSGLDAFHED